MAIRYFYVPVNFGIANPTFSWSNISGTNGYWWTGSGGTGSRLTGLPTYGDTVIFDKNSNPYFAGGNNSYTINIDTTARLTSLTISNPSAGIVTFTGSSGILFQLTSSIDGYLEINSGVNWQNNGSFRTIESGVGTSKLPNLGVNISSTVGTIENSIGLLNGSPSSINHLVLYSDLSTRGLIYTNSLSLGGYYLTCSLLQFTSANPLINSDYDTNITITGSNGRVFYLNGIDLASDILLNYTQITLDFTYQGSSGIRTIWHDLSNNSNYLNPDIISTLFNINIYGNDSIIIDASSRPHPVNDLTIYNGTRTITLNSDLNIYGNLTLPLNSSMVPGVSGGITSAPTIVFLNNPYYYGPYTITSNNSTINADIIFQGEDYSGWYIYDNFTIASSKAVLFRSGYIDVSGITLTCGTIKGIRAGRYPSPIVIQADFPATFQLTRASDTSSIPNNTLSSDPSSSLIYTTATVFNVDPINFDISLASPNLTVKLNSSGANSGAYNRTVCVGAGSNTFGLDQNVSFINFWISDGSGYFDFEPKELPGAVIGDLDFRGFTGIFVVPSSSAVAGTLNIYGSLYLGNAQIPGLSTSVTKPDNYKWIMNPYNSNRNYESIISSNGKTITWPLVLDTTIPNSGGTFTLADNFNYDLSLSGFKAINYPLCLFNGVFNINGKTATTTYASMISDGGMTINSGTLTCNTFTQAGILTLDLGGKLVSSTPFNFNGGQLNTLNGTTIECPRAVISTTVISTGTINFDTGFISVKSITNGIYVWDSTNPQSHQYVTFTDSGGGVRLDGVGVLGGVRYIYQGNIDSETNSVNFYIRAGQDQVRFTNNTTGIKNLDLTGFSGSLYSPSLKLYGNLTLSSDATFLTATEINFAASTGTKTIATSNNPLFSTMIKFTFNGTASYRLLDNVNGLTSWTLNSGTLDLNRKTLSVQQFTSTSSTNRTLNMTSSTILMTNNNSNIPAIWTVTNTLVMQSNTGSNIYFVGNGGNVLGNNIFNGGGNSYNLVGIKDNGYAGGINITGENTFVTLQQDVYTATTWTFASSSTTIVTNFNISGKDAANRANIRSSTSGTQFTLSKSSGIVSVKYTSIQDSNATGGARWFALKRQGNTDG